MRATSDEADLKSEAFSFEALQKALFNQQVRVVV